MRASLKQSTSLSLAALVCAALLSAAPIDGAMARGEGGAADGAAGAGAGAGTGTGGGSGGPSVVKASVIAPDLSRRPPIRKKIVLIHSTTRSGCYMQAEQLNMELPEVEVISFLNKCLSDQ